jgi:hypothetical protein
MRFTRVAPFELIPRLPPRPAFAGHGEGVAMEGHTFATGLVLCAGLTAGQTATAQTLEQPIVHVVLMDRAAVPADTLERAQNDTTRVFELSGITLVWVDAETCQAPCLTVWIVMRPMGPKSRDSRVLGIAPGTKEVRGTNVWIFYPRIQAHSANLGMDASELLGHVMAHELGHLLLPYDAHSFAGVMRPAWDRAQVANALDGRLTFMPAQAALIRARLQDASATTARR